MKTLGKFLFTMYGYFCIWLPLPVYVNIFFVQALGQSLFWRLAASTGLVGLLCATVKLNLWVSRCEQDRDE